jgi:hypothetical protein
MGAWRRTLFALAGLGLAAFASPPPPTYSIEAIRYATVPGFPRYPTTGRVARIR